MSMLHIEKVTSQHDQTPGLVDIFVKNNQKSLKFGNWSRYTASEFGKQVCKNLENDKIFIGTQFGTDGIDLSKLINCEDKLKPNTVFEISALSYISMSTLERRSLKKYKYYIHDFIEGTYYIEEMAKTLKDVTYVSSCSHSEITNINIPIFAFYTLAETLQTQDIKFKPYTGKGKLALLPCHKPRPNRVNLLERLDDLGVLNDIDWSLFVNFDKSGEPGDFYKSSNVSLERWRWLSYHPFIRKYKNILPRTLDDIANFSECLPLPKNLNTRYKWYIGCETYNYTHFVTEKTFKGFLGCMPTLTLAEVGFNSHLEKYGFIMPGKYDHLEDSARIEGITETLLNNNIPYLDDAVETNFKLITDLDFLSNLVSKELQKLFKE